MRGRALKWPPRFPPSDIHALCNLSLNVRGCKVFSLLRLNYVLWQRRRTLADGMEVPDHDFEFIKRESILDGPDLIRQDLLKKVQAFLEREI